MNVFVGVLLNFLEYLDVSIDLNVYYYHFFVFVGFKSRQFYIVKDVNPTC